MDERTYVWRDRFDGDYFHFGSKLTHGYELFATLFYEQIGDLLGDDLYEEVISHIKVEDGPVAVDVHICAKAYAREGWLDDALMVAERVIYKFLQSEDAGYLSQLWQVVQSRQAAEHLVSLMREELE